jgi:hypothetical protein
MVMIPGSHKGPIAAHHDSRASDNILSRGQTIAEPIDEGRARHVVLAPGELSLHHGRVLAQLESQSIGGPCAIAFNAQYLAPMGQARQWAIGTPLFLLVVRGSVRTFRA